MPSVAHLRPDLVKTLRRYQLEKKFAKQLALFINNPRHPSLNTELLEPKKRGLYSLRIDRKFRAIYIFLSRDLAEIISITHHYND
ncbi:hypothetical protein HYW32_02360 [Candidatus Berkelbacteria bacterium]|nr:hypothetical protein [Candidatus Berkelbacteria bacterium]